MGALAHPDLSSAQQSSANAATSTNVLTSASANASTNAPAQGVPAAVPTSPAQMMPATARPTVRGVPVLMRMRTINGRWIYVQVLVDPSVLYMMNGAQASQMYTPPAYPAANMHSSPQTLYTGSSINNQGSYQSTPYNGGNYQNSSGVSSGSNRAAPSSATPVNSQSNQGNQRAPSKNSLGQRQQMGGTVQHVQQNHIPQQGGSGHPRHNGR